MTPRKAYATGPDGQVHYRDAGAGRPLLLLHQTPCHLGQFDAAFPLLVATGIRVIAVDTPGYGQSDPPRGTPTIAAYAGAMLAVLDDLGPPHPLHAGLEQRDGHAPWGSDDAAGRAARARWLHGRVLT
jgi:pimeloyl-ACP methyl ester carboxylesterase